MGMGMWGLGSALLVLLCGNTVQATNNTTWWHNAVVYQIYPRSFMDSDGDGIGDLNGIKSKLSYLADLGITAIWLSPIFESPQKDFGYDISNYTEIDSIFGTMEDFEEMLAKAHEVGLKLLLDMVPNHTSNEHPWFKLSENKTGNYTDYYVWHAGNTSSYNSTLGRYNVPNNWISAFEDSAWEWSDTREEYYLHQFLTAQPDLNYSNPHVVTEIKNVYKFWMAKGVDGFRVDAVPYLFEDPDFRSEPSIANISGCSSDEACSLLHIYTQNLNATFDMVQQWRAVIDDYNTSEVRLMMTECYSPNWDLVKYYGNESVPGADFPFNFVMISDVTASSNASYYKEMIDEYMELLDDWMWPNWVIGNHDNERAATRFPGMEDSMNMISLMLPGTGVTYNGEELGMTDTFITWAETKDTSALRVGESEYESVTRDPERTPYQWSDAVSAGFSSNATTWLPSNPNYWELNVEAQEAASNSHLKIYKEIVAARQNSTLQGRSNYETAVLGENILQITRDGDVKFVVLVNVGSFEEHLTADDYDGNDLVVYTASLSFGMEKGDSAAYGLRMRPKSGVILTNGTVSSSSSNSTTESSATTESSSTSAAAVLGASSVFAILPVVAFAFRR